MAINKQGKGRINDGWKRQTRKKKGKSKIDFWRKPDRYKMKRQTVGNQ